MRYICKVCDVAVDGFGAKADPEFCGGRGKEHDFRAESEARLMDQMRSLLVERFESLYLHADGKVKIFEERGSVSTPSFSYSVKQDPYWGNCAVGGRMENPHSKKAIDRITRAHILVNSNKTKLKDTYGQFGIAGGYVTDFDGFSARNHMPLCGNEGVSGSCHDAFGKFEMCLVYNPLARRIRVYWPNSGHNNKEFLPPFVPYRRLLNFRSRFQAITRHDLDLLNLSCIGQGAEPSESGEPPSKKVKTTINKANRVNKGTGKAKRKVKEMITRHVQLPPRTMQTRGSRLAASGPPLEMQH